MYLKLFKITNCILTTNCKYDYDDDKGVQNRPNDPIFT